MRVFLRSGEPDTAFEPIPLTTLAGSEGYPSFSPDGSQVVFQWDGEQSQQTRRGPNGG
jgi:hypothetical protein